MSEENPNILIYILDDQRDEVELVARRLDREGISNYHIYTSEDEFLLNFSNNNVDIAIVDFKLGGPLTGLDILKEINRINNFCKTIIISGSSAVDTVIQSFRAGAADFIDKNCYEYLQELVDSIRRLIPSIERRIYYQKKWLAHDIK